MAEEFDGICIASTRGGGEAFAQEIIDALAFLKRHDPRRFRMVRRTTDYIVDRSLPWGRNCGNYLRGIRTTSIDYDPLDPGWDDPYRHGFFAGIIIHEATHGRIKDLGIPSTEDNRVQVERICVSEENRFYRKIAPVREGLAEDLCKPFDPSKWDRIWASGPLAQLRMSYKRAKEKSKADSGPGE